MIGYNLGGQGTGGLRPACRVLSHHFYLLRVSVVAATVAAALPYLLLFREVLLWTFQGEGEGLPSSNCWW